MELRQLEAFVEAAHAGSVSRAARTLYLTQPSLTQRVRALEADLGQPLLVRSGRGVRLTPAGELFLPRAEAALRALRRGAEEVRALRAGDGGRLAIAASSDAAAYLLPAAVARFRGAHPAVEVSVLAGQGPAMAAMVVAEHADVAIVVRPVQIAVLQARLLFEERLLAVAGAGHPLAGIRVPEGGAITVGEFAAAGLVTREPESYLHELTVAFFAAHDLTPAITVRGDTTEAVKRMIAAGAGVGLVPEHAVRAELAAGTLVRLPLGPGRVRLPSRGVWALARPDRVTAESVVAIFLALLLADVAGTDAGAVPAVGQRRLRLAAMAKADAGTRRTTRAKGA